MWYKNVLKIKNSRHLMKSFGDKIRRKSRFLYPDKNLRFIHILYVYSTAVLFWRAYLDPACKKQGKIFVKGLGLEQGLLFCPTDS